MSQTLTVSDDLYARLEQTAQQRGLPRVEDLLEIWQTTEDERNRRREVVQRIDDLRERLFATYGEMPDSCDLLREDRER